MFASGKKASGAFASRFACYQNQAQSLVKDVWTKLVWRTKWYDGLDELDITTNQRFTALATGYYSFTASLAVTAVADNTSIGIRFSVNGQSENKGGSTNTSFCTHVENWTYVQTSIDVYLEAGEYVEVEGLQGDTVTRSYADRIMNWCGRRVA